MVLSVKKWSLDIDLTSTKIESAWIIVMPYEVYKKDNNDFSIDFCRDSSPLFH